MKVTTADKLWMAAFNYLAYDPYIHQLHQIMFFCYRYKFADRRSCAIFLEDSE